MATSTRSAGPKYTVPGLSIDDASDIVGVLQDRLNALNDLALTLKHVHWNVVGPHFIAVHTMLDPQVEAVRLMVDETAERIATLGGSPGGTPGALVAARTWDDYSIGRADAIAHMGGLDVAYAGIIEAHRQAIEATDETDPVTGDMLIKQTGQLEQFQWFVRAHLENASGALVTTEREPSAARRRKRTPERCHRKTDIRFGDHRALL
jgi:starvation-inducible DNA-binding protein